MANAGQTRQQATYDAAWARHGDNFPYRYHDYSEALFLDACTFLREGDVGIDAGCYHAVNALRMADNVGDSGLVFTFEPDPRMREKSEQAISASPIGSRVRLNAVALSNAPSHSDFVVVNELPGHSGLRQKRPERYGQPVTTWTIPVDITTLDLFLAERSVDLRKVRLIKFDLEGGELHAFRGAEDTLREGRPLLLFEYGNLGVYGNEPQHFVDYFASLDYRIIDAYGFDMLSKADLDLGSISGWNMFAAPDAEAAAYVRRLIAARRDEFVVLDH